MNFQMLEPCLVFYFHIFLFVFYDFDNISFKALTGYMSGDNFLCVSFHQFVAGICCRKYILHSSHLNEVDYHFN